ncbi:MAG: SIS domain-containing protein [bacterium]
MELESDYLEKVVQAAADVDLKEARRCIDALESAYHEGRSVFVIGNGGSASNASHFAQDLSKGSVVELEGRRFRVLSLTDNVSFITALANDIGYERVFDLQLRQFGQRGDMLVAISGSGKSPNILRAAQYARDAGIMIVGVTGFDGGPLRTLSDIRLHVPVMDMCKTEAVHSILLHLISDLLRDRLAARRAADAKGR